ncbi:CsgG/HfaB family protein [Roseateles chitosanitabidus]|uniref:CsgG/HfaB family protein n=1 Tax=Roseateles chitosanitabidus TaxID=65048 RepID=UPI00082F1BD5|nr:CsgG/HfaB family protein [Roseateles chitosanitabidus]MBO9688607.1 peptidoglycan-binding protein [Roseateles chitosanitabidus]
MLATPARLASSALKSALLLSPLLLTACMATAPTMGDNKGTVSGAAGGATAENKNSQLEHCDETLGTLAIFEDTNAPWWAQLRERQLGSTLPVLRLMVQQSNCFVIVERGRAFANMERERALMQSGETRAGSNFGQGQMVAADYTMSPEIQFAGKTGGGGGGIGTGAIGLLTAVAANISQNEASTTLLLVDNRSGVQISAAEGTAKNFDFGIGGASFFGNAAVAGGAYGKTPAGKVIVTAFADSYNQMVKALRNYKAQTVKGGLGTGGRLGVQGGSTAASQEVDGKAATTATKPAPKPAAKSAPKKATTTSTPPTNNSGTGK